MRGRFITFEGIDGAGKSTHHTWMVEFLRAQDAQGQPLLLRVLKSRPGRGFSERNLQQRFRQGYSLQQRAHGGTGPLGDDTVEKSDGLHIAGEQSHKIRQRPGQSHGPCAVRNSGRNCGQMKEVFHVDGLCSLGWRAVSMRETGANVQGASRRDQRDSRCECLSLRAKVIFTGARIARPWARLTPA